MDASAGLRGIACGLALSASASAQELEADEHTRLLLHCNGNANGVAGESPTQFSGATFEAGVHGSGLRIDGADQVSFAAAGEFEPAAGTVEFWVRPSWNGTDGQGRFFFSVGGGLLLAKDGADNLVFIILQPDSEAFRATYLGAWSALEWHHVAATWEIPGAMRVYVDGFERIAHPASSQDLLEPVPPLLWIGSREGLEQAEAVFDELRISDVARSAAEIARSFLAGALVSELEVLPIANTMYPTWRQAPRLRATTSRGVIDLPGAVAQWSTSDPFVATVDEEGLVTAHASGAFELVADLGDAQASAPITVAAPVRPVERGPIDPFLATPAPGHLHEVPVLLLRYLPTQDGANLDVSWDPDFFDLGHLTLDQASARIAAFDRRVKFMLEEGSRFRGYGNPSARPSLGYRVVEYITVYEPTPPGKPTGAVAGLPVYWPDYGSIFERFGVEELVNERGVREIWFWSGGVNPAFPSYDPLLHLPEKLRGSWESNMSSPVTGDVSNSDRDPGDLPVYEHSYIVYGQNVRRTQAEAVHNHGHQLEAMLSHANELQDGSSELFWQRFVGRDASFQWTQGRCGDTHHPPNALSDYDYVNFTPVASDIEDWTPGGTGRRTLVSAATWGELPYAWPDGPPPEQRIESQWYVYWMQSMPGHGNGIPFGADVLTDWWRFTGDWDGSILGGLGLHGAPPAFAHVLVAGEGIELDRPDESRGALHANDDIRLRKNGKTVLGCDLTAVDDIAIERGNEVEGAVTAGGEVKIERGASVLGPVTAHAAVAPLGLPRPSFTAGGPDRTVEERESLSLEPGSYGRVLVRRRGTLQLRTGSYAFEQLLTEREALLTCEVAGGAVALNVTGELVLAERVQITSSEGDLGSERVALATLQRARLELGDRSRLLGTLVAPDAPVVLAKGASFQGAIFARSIRVEHGASFRPHPDAPDR